MKLKIVMPSFAPIMVGLLTGFLLSAVTGFIAVLGVFEFTDKLLTFKNIEGFRGPSKSELRRQKVEAKSKEFQLKLKSFFGYSY